MWSPAPIERTIASELGSTGSVSTRRFQWLSAGNTGQPASTAAPTATLPYNSARARRAEAARLALRQLAVAPDVAVLAARHEVQSRLVAHVLYAPHRRGVNAREPARAEQVLSTVAEGDPHVAPVDEIELLLLVVVVATRAVARRDLDRVHAKRGHAKLAPHLAEAGPLAQRLDVCDCVAVALHDPVDLALVSHAQNSNRLGLGWTSASAAASIRPSRRCAGPRAPRASSAPRGGPQPRTPERPWWGRRRGSPGRPRAPASPGSRTPRSGPSP